MRWEKFVVLFVARITEPYGCGAPSEILALGGVARKTMDPNSLAASLLCCSDGDLWGMFAIQTAYTCEKDRIARTISVCSLPERLCDCWGQ